MLKRVGHPVDEKGAAVAIKDATFPVPFASGLEILYCHCNIGPGMDRHIFTGCDDEYLIRIAFSHWQ